MPQSSKYIAPPIGSVWIEEAAARLGVAKSTLYKWRMRKFGPQGYAVARRIAYKISVLDEYLHDCQAASAA